MNDFTDEGRLIEGLPAVAGSGALAILNRSEIEQQVDTAHKYPRSIKRFRDEMMQMVTLSETVAGECFYALPRDGKVIEGPSARFAEVAASAWGNCRAGARIVSDQGEFITAQGVFHDLERNVALTYEVQRRIVDKNGKRYKPDMIGVTGNAASSIALRNAILKGIPKAFWSDMFTAARRCAVGDIKAIANKRVDAIKAFTAYGITEAQILTKLGRPGIQDISIDDLVTLLGLFNAIKDGDTTPEQAFADDTPVNVAMPQSKAKAEPPAHAPPADGNDAATVTPAASPAAGEADTSGKPKPSVMKMIFAKRDDLGIHDNTIFDKFAMASWEDVTVNKATSIMEWLVAGGK